MTKSKTTTFYKWLKETAIEIPMLQRDYAQGRDDSKTKELRKNFVSDLLKAIKRETEDEKRHLDFIYGPESDGTFQPLDGQQRLTTLFLIHWYLAAKAGRLPEAKEVLEKFRYKVRVSTQEFITALLIPDNAPCKELSKKNLTDAKWYFSSWDYDPSIQGMLNMIDTIYENLQNKDQAECSNLWNLLVCENAKDAPITFTVLNMEKFGLGDELYMRMNARGLALSDFENFKAWLHGQCERKALNDDRYFSEPKDNFTPSEKHWGYKLDREWTAFFWEKSGYDPKSMNDTFLRFFQLTALNSFAGEHKGNIDPSKKNKEEYKKAELFKTNISRLAGEEEHIPNKDYEKTYNLLDGDTLNDLFALFDFIAVKGDSWLKETLEPVPFFFEDQSTPVDILYKKKLTYPQRVLFHALQKFVTKNGFQKESKEHRDALIAWMRVTRNLVVNSNIDAPAPFVRAIKSTNSLLPKSFAKKSWLEYLSDETTQIEGFSTDQIAEERLKAKLMLGSNGENWEQVIIDAENHPLFRGQIGFLFQKTELSGSETKVAKLELATIQRRLENAEQFFSEIGVTEPFVQDSILMRAYISRMTKWEQLFNIPFGNGTDTWREVILKVKERQSKKLAPFLSLLEIAPANALEQLKEWIEEDSKINTIGAVQKRVHHDLYKTPLLIHAEKKSYLKGWSDESKALSKFIYYLMPYNAKSEKKKVVIGMKRNEILAKLIKCEKITSPDQLKPDLSFFRCPSVKFQYNNKKYRWDWHDQIYLEGTETPLVLQEQGVTEETLDDQKVLDLLDQLESTQQG